MATRLACILMGLLAVTVPAFGQGPGDVPLPRAVLQPPDPLGRPADDAPPLPPAIIQPPDQAPPDAVLQPKFPPPPGDAYLPDGSRLILPSGVRQTIQFVPRYGTLGQVQIDSLEDGTTRLVHTTGMIIKVQVQPAAGPFQEYEFAADRVVLWAKGIGNTNLLGGVTVESADPNGGTQIELYLAGNVVIRTQEYQRAYGMVLPFQRVLRADQIYYDVKTNRAVALDADLEYQTQGVADNAHLFGKTIYQRGRGDFRAVQAGAHASKLPSDPGVVFRSGDVELVETDRQRRNVFGIPYRRLFPTAGEPGAERLITARNTRVELMGVPVFYTPFYRADASEPFGPLDGVGFGNDRIFGTQVFTSWSVYRALGVTAPPGHRWRFNADYLSDRGTAFGTDYDFSNADFFGFGGRNNGVVRLWGLEDRGFDNLGGFRGFEPIIKSPGFRGRALYRYSQELFADKDPDTGLLTGERFLSLQSQFAWLSDKNFLEQYFKPEFDFGPNQETFLNLTASNGKWYGTLLAQGGQDREWITETRKLPRAHAALVGQSIFDRLSYTSRAEVGYFELRPTVQPYEPFLPYQQTDVRSSVGRADWWQELSAPVHAGPLTVTPYGVLNLTGYTEDNTGHSTGRVYGGGGVRSAVNFSRVYQDASSELFNVRGLNHKVTVGGNYYFARSSVPYTQFPLIDRLNDDAIDQAYRTTKRLDQRIVDRQAIFAVLLDPQFDPQKYAIRRLVDTNVDTRDDIQVVQANVLQRLQTKRGFAGREHTVDWLTLDLSASFFPDPLADNFGQTESFFEYNTAWNVGDRTALLSSGWFDPFTVGTRFYQVGVLHGRPDGTDFYFGYRQTDPLNSKVVTASVSYQLTKKYSLQAGGSYDFGVQQSLFNSLTLTRTGTDLTITVGLSYNAFQNNFGFQFAIIPNLAVARGARGILGPQAFGQRP